MVTGATLAAVSACGNSRAGTSRRRLRDCEPLNRPSATAVVVRGFGVVCEALGIIPSSSIRPHSNADELGRRRGTRFSGIAA